MSFLAGNVPNILHQVTVPIINNDKCQNMFIKSGHKKTVRESFLCAGYDKGQKDSCEVKAISFKSYLGKPYGTKNLLTSALPNSWKKLGRGVQIFGCHHMALQMQSMTYRNGL